MPRIPTPQGRGREDQCQTRSLLVATAKRINAQMMEECMLHWSFFDTFISFAQLSLMCLFFLTAPMKLDRPTKRFPMNQVPFPWPTRDNLRVEAPNFSSMCATILFWIGSTVLAPVLIPSLERYGIGNGCLRFMTCLLTFVCVCFVSNTIGHGRIRSRGTNQQGSNEE
jgi:FtsH-binding integral membrane protein